VKEALRMLEALYAELDVEIAELGCECRACGRCCRFREYGHELFLSSLELEYLLEDGPAPAALEAGRCPYQLGAACAARKGRALSCRSFFCSGDVERQRDLCERYHGRIGRDLGLSWRYGPLGEMLGSALSRPRRPIGA
jgi:hypothetical protein